MKKVVSFLVTVTLMMGLTFGGLFSAKAASSVTVWFYNNVNWATVNAYVYNATPTKEALGGWPGKPATRDGSTKWWKVTVPTNVPFNIIFNNGAGAQSAGVYIDNATKVYTTITADSKFDSKAAAEKSAGVTTKAPTVVTTKVWFYNSKGWEKVAGYVYNSATANPTGAWPGKPATRDGNSNWYYLNVTAALPFNIMFNNGGDGTDLSGKMNTRIGDSKNVYTTVINDVTFDSKSKAEASVPKGGATVSPAATTNAAETVSQEQTTLDAAAITSDTTAGTTETTAIAQSVKKGMNASAIIVIVVFVTALLIAAALVFVIIYLRKKKLNK